MFVTDFHGLQLFYVENPCTQPVVQSSQVITKSDVCSFKSQWLFLSEFISLNYNLKLLIPLTSQVSRLHCNYRPSFPFGLYWWHKCTAHRPWIWAQKLRFCSSTDWESYARKIFIFTLGSNRGGNFTSIKLLNSTGCILKYGLQNWPITVHNNNNIISHGNLPPCHVSVAWRCPISFCYYQSAHLVQLQKLSITR